MAVLDVIGLSELSVNLPWKERTLGGADGAAKVLGWGLFGFTYAYIEYDKTDIKRARIANLK